MTTYTTDPVIGGEGWAIQRIGPLVLGFWNVPLAEDRIHACRRLYRSARKEHGKLTVFAVFRQSPFSIDVVAAQSARTLTLSLMKEFAGAFDAVIIVMDATGFQATLSRLAAATFIGFVSRAVPITFPGSTDAGVAVGHRSGSFRIVDEATARACLASLEREVLGGRFAMASPGGTTQAP